MGTRFVTKTSKELQINIEELSADLVFYKLSSIFTFIIDTAIVN